MCKTENREALRNGHAADLATQGHAIADILDALSGLETQLREIPTREEVRNMIDHSLHNHLETCAVARTAAPQKPAEKNVFKLSKMGIEAEGRSGVIFGALCGIIVVLVLLKVAPFVGSWIQNWGAK